MFFFFSKSSRRRPHPVVSIFPLPSPSFPSCSAVPALPLGYFHLPSSSQPPPPTRLKLPSLSRQKKKLTAPPSLPFLQPFLHFFPKTGTTISFRSLPYSQRLPSPSPTARSSPLKPAAPILPLGLQRTEPTIGAADLFSFSTASFPSQLQEQETG